MRWGWLLVLTLWVGGVCAPVWGQAVSAAAAVDTSAAAEAGEPLPAIPELLKDVERNEKAAEKAQKDYTYHVHVVQQEVDGKGKVKKTETVDSQSLTIDGVRVDRVLERYGKPLTPEEAKKESERIDKEVAKDKERREKLEGQGKATDARGDQVLTLSRILELGEFTNARRVELNGRPTIVVEYAGDPKAKTRDRFESMFRDLVGTVWIDEKDRTVAQVQGHFLNDFKIGGGLLADIRKGSSFRGTWEKVNGEVWLPAEFEGEGKIRVLLLLGFNGRVSLATSDYQKFRTSATILQSDRVIGEDGKPVETPEAAKP